MTNLTKLYSYYLGLKNFLENLGGHAKFYIITATKQWLNDENYDETLLSEQSNRDPSYPEQVGRIKAKIEALSLVMLSQLKVTDEIPKVNIEVFSYARMVSFDIRKKLNAWGKALVSVCFITLGESSLNQSDLIRSTRRFRARWHPMAAQSQFGIRLACSLCARFTKRGKILAVHRIPDLACQNYERRKTWHFEKHSRSGQSASFLVPLRWRPRLLGHSASEHDTRL
jgi:hypothetical protein